MSTVTFSASLLRSLNAPIRVIKERALAGYCKSRISSYDGENSCCISCGEYDGECPINKEIVSRSEYVTWSEEINKAIRDCEFTDGEHYPDEWLDIAYRLLPPGIRMESNKKIARIRQQFILKELHDNYLMSGNARCQPI